MNETRQWIDQLERKVFSTAFDEPPVSKSVVYSVLKKCTVLNELMHHVTDDYVRDFVNDMYKSPRINMHGLKRFVILDYPLSVIESIFREEQKKKIRSLRSGFYPYYKGQEINACATLSPFGESVIFFSEWLFAFLWDYFHQISEIPHPDLKSTNGDHPYLNQIRKVNNEFILKLSTGVYKNWDIKKILSLKNNTSYPKYNLLFSLIFIWAHELGHIFLSHLDSSKTKQLLLFSEDGSKQNLKVFNIDQELELDADMFASDIYFHYLSKGITFASESIKQSIVSRAFDFFILLAHSEMSPDDEEWNDADHPSSPMRLLYICLRHEEILSSYGWELFNILEKKFGKDKFLSQYNYRKDFGTNLLLD